MRFVLSIGPCNHKRLDDAYSMAATDDKSQSASQSSKNSDVVFAYCPVCKANYGDYSGKCLCNSDVLEEKEEGKDSGSEKENAKDTRETDYGVCGASVEQCMHREGLQNTFDIKVQNMDTSGDTCLSRSETHSEPCPPINVVLEEQCATDVCEEIGLSTVCAITENVLGRRRKHATLPATELGLCSMNNAQSTRQIASTSSTSLLQEIGSDARLQDEKTKRRTFDVFIVDNEGNMDTYELNKIHSDKGSHIVVNKKECGRRIRHSTAEEPVKSIQVERLSRCRDTAERKASFRVRVVGDGGALTAAELSVEGIVFRLLGNEANVNNVVVRPLKDSELFRMGRRERGLALCVAVIDEVPRTASPCTRASMQMLEDAIRKEESIQEGIERIMRVSTGAAVADAQAQLEGSRRRLAYLRGEIERGRREGLNVADACEKLYEYNNHVFRVQTFSPQTLCEHCNDVMRGTCSQGLGCDECGMAVHRNCYVLTETSCEMFSALSSGKQYYVVMRSLEERERLLRWARM